MADSAEFDYVIVGAGSAGCVLAARLSENSDVRVLLLEAGGSDFDPFVQIPAGVKQLNPKLNWRLTAEPDESRGGVIEDWAAGKILGGSSSINGMAWVRGHPADFDAWASDGCTGWDYASLRPYFQKMETYEGTPGPERGTAGPQHVSPVRIDHPVTRAFLAAAANAGLPYREDYNAGEQFGASRSQLSQRRGWRHSTARAYLGRARRRKNLVVRTGVTVSKVIVEQGRAVGVEYCRGQHSEQVGAKKEVLLSAGALATPRLLMLSGIGPAEHLGEHGIDVVVDAPGVGSNLQEHPITLFLHRVTMRTLNRELTPKGVLKHGIDFVLRGRGAVTSPACHAVAFFGKTDGGATKFQFMFSPFGVIGKPSANSIEDPSLSDMPGDGSVRLTHDVNAMKLLPQSSVTTYPCVLHPVARGVVRLHSADPNDPPKIHHELLAAPEDVKALTEAARKLREVFAADGLSEYVMEEMRPGPSVQSDEEWEEYLRSNTFRAEHPVGTARMGTETDAVVDPELRVRGVDGLRVVDASIMPTLVSGNTNAATIVIAEKAADIILEHRVADSVA